MIKKDTAKKIVKTMENIEKCEKALEYLKDKDPKRIRGKYLKGTGISVFWGNNEADGIYIDIVPGIAIAAIKEQLELYQIELEAVNDKIRSEIEEKS